MLTAYITAAGQAAIVGARFGGYHIALTRFKVSDTLITETDSALIRAYTELPGTLVYDSGNNPTDFSIKYEVINTTDCTVTIFLNADIGPFTIGSLGLYLPDGTLFAILKLEQTYSKSKNDSGVAGNTFAFPLVTTITLLEVLDTTVLPENFATLPQVATDSLLPEYNLAPHGNYFVQNFAGTGKAAIACRTADSWQFTTSSNQNLYEGWIKVEESSFASGVVEGDVVTFNYNSNLWERFDSNSSSAKLVGVRNGLGIRVSSFYYKENAFISNTDYFCDTAPNQGKLTSLSTQYFIGTALTENILCINPRRVGEDLVQPSIPKIFSAIADTEGVWQLTLPDTYNYPEVYEGGLEIKFIAPSTSVAEQEVQIKGLDTIPLTKKLPESSSTTTVGLGEISMYTLVEATFVIEDSTSGGFRLAGATLFEGKVDKMGDTMLGALTTPQVILGNETTNPTDAARKDYVDSQWFVGDEKRSYQNSNHGRWLLLNGQAVSRTTYSALFALLGTTHGVGDGTTTFNLYDCRGRVNGSIGQGVGLTNRSNGDVVGNETHTLSIAEMPAHTHDLYSDDNAGAGGGANPDYQAPSSGGVFRGTTRSTGGGQAHNIMQPTVFAGNTFIYAGV